MRRADYPIANIVVDRARKRITLNVQKRVVCVSNIYDAWFQFIRPIGRGTHSTRTVFGSIRGRSTSLTLWHMKWSTWQRC